MSKVQCPICGRPTAEQYAPFCSGRCADVDLGRWFNGNYRFESTRPLEGEELNAVLNAQQRENGE